jgi:hypothetical protein
MVGRVFERIESSGKTFDQPIVLHQSNPRASRIPGLILMLVLAGAIVIPQIGFAGYAVVSPTIRNTLKQQPIIAVELALALAFWAILIVWPLRTILIALMSDRIVDIRDGIVSVVDRAPFASQHWQAPLAVFEGVALYTRSSLSGVRQEAVLVHPERYRSLILATGERIGADELERLSSALHLPLISAERLYELRAKPQGRQNAMA